MITIIYFSTNFINNLINITAHFSIVLPDKYWLRKAAHVNHVTPVNTATIAIGKPKLASKNDNIIVALAKAVIPSKKPPITSP